MEILKATVDAKMEHMARVGLQYVLRPESHYDNLKSLHWFVIAIDCG